ncbi:hypothetical protein ACFE04_011775 [Oxalis oulophora]
MAIEMPRGLPFSVDTFNQNSKLKRHHFLTHAHKDHTIGITTHSSYPIYCTHLTFQIIHQYYPQLDEFLFVRLQLGHSLLVHDPDGDFTVTPFDANHCPGAVMFLFEGSFGNILHTGDCRLTPDCVRTLPQKYIANKGKHPTCCLDYVFLDCTFGKFSHDFPTKHSAIRQVINCIWKHPKAPVVYLTCDLLGQEEILLQVSKTFGSKIFVDKTTNPDFFEILKLTVPEILSQDPNSRFQLFDGFPKLPERASAKLAEARANSLPEPLIIRPSAQWYACEELNEKRVKLKYSEAQKDQFGIWHVCYSMHSSREELEWALQLLSPKRVVSTTPNCRAMELTYVKKHCLGTQIATDDPLWKLLDIGVEVSSKAIVSVKQVGCSSTIEQQCTRIFAPAQPQPVERSPRKKVLLSLSPPRKIPPVTLFGRARIGLPESYPFEEMKTTSVISEEKSTSSEVVTEANFESKLKIQKDVKVAVLHCEESVKENITEESSLSFSGSPKDTDRPFKGYNESMRKLYRSMNVSVPQPLPSLVLCLCGDQLYKAGSWRLSFKMKSLDNSEMDVEGGRIEKDGAKTVRSHKAVKIVNPALLSGLAYCISSCSMILVNKFVLSSYNFNAGISLMLYQNFISVIIVSTLSILGVISTEPLTWRLIKVWLPVNFIFVGMLITSMFSLKYINVAMVTVLKNITNVITAVGEMYLFSKHHDNRVWAALFLMIISAVSGGITDLSFNAVGYTWQLANCFLTASYSLTLRRVMDTAKQVTKSGNLNEFSMVLLNNTLSLPLGIFLIFVFNEVDYLSQTPLLRLPTFWLVMTLSGFLGLAISFTSMWFLHQTGATTYSLVGSLNKIPLSVAGIFLFHVPTSVENSASILFGLLGGVFFARAKLREKSQS